MNEPSASEIIRGLITSSAVASLGTIDVDGAPFVTMVTYAATGPSRVVMLLSGLAKHTKNLDSNRQASLLIAAADETSDPMTAARVTLTGQVGKLPRDTDSQARQTFLAKHSAAAMYADFGDFAFYEFEIENAHLVAGFGLIKTISGKRLHPE